MLWTCGMLSIPLKRWICWGIAGEDDTPEIPQKSSGLTPSPADHTLENSINGLIKAGRPPLDRWLDLDLKAEMGYNSLHPDVLTTDQSSRGGEGRLAPQPYPLFLRREWRVLGNSHKASRWANPGLVAVRFPSRIMGRLASCAIPQVCLNFKDWVLCPRKSAPYWKIPWNSKNMPAFKCCSWASRNLSLTYNNRHSLPSPSPANTSPRKETELVTMWAGRATIHSCTGCSLHKEGAEIQPSLCLPSCAP